MERVLLNPDQSERPRIDPEQECDTKDNSSHKRSLGENISIIVKEYRNSLDSMCRKSDIMCESPLRVVYIARDRQFPREVCTNWTEPTTCRILRGIHKMVRVLLDPEQDEEAPPDPLITNH